MKLVSELISHPVQDFLSVSPELWKLQQIPISQANCSTIRVINDCAERVVMLETDLN